MIDADGRVLGVYRKSHIPDGPGYQEKFYFNPGDTGFRVWHTKAGCIGVGICWDQWFPEAARIMALHGAELILYPTAIGSEPHDAGYDSRDHWQRVMQGHAAANMMPVVAVQPHRHRGGRRAATLDLLRQLVHHRRPRANVEEAPREGEAVLTATFDLDDAGERSAPPGACSATGGPTSTSRS